MDHDSLSKHTEIPSLSNIINSSIIIQSHTNIRPDGKIESYCGLRIREVTTNEAGTLTTPEKKRENIKQKAAVPVSNIPKKTRKRYQGSTSNYHSPTPDIISNQVKRRRPKQNHKRIALTSTAPCEAVWRLFSFDINYSYPSVMKLNYHLPNQNAITPRDSESLPALLAKEVSRPRQLWQENWEALSEDILHKKRKHFRYPTLELTEEQIQNYCLVEIEELLHKFGRSLAEFEDLPRPNPKLLTNMDNRLIREALDFDMNRSKIEHEQLHSMLNTDQLLIYQSVIDISFIKSNFK
ncbi:hypothetical protein CTI12_AA438830 [Artemisia annua]|uniref:Uncharacterized protein n=1 Tax=Artemisia annua TaxID=35608 RepID=A0A2U1LXW8_ARTAN|nr:hypothetical protein CTI12_AA438830 [Artemisia annua]